MATELERMMAELLAGADETKTGADDARKSAAKTRRRSRDLEMQLNEMVSVQESMQTMIQFRRNSKDAELNEAEAKTIFDEIDTDKSGKLGKDELLAVRCLALPMSPASARLLFPIEASMEAD